eukprot:scaffold4855_cov195-Amphora_coffeaeformis.AAC.15
MSSVSEGRPRGALHTNRQSTTVTAANNNHGNCENRSSHHHIHSLALHCYVKMSTLLPRNVVIDSICSSCSSNDEDEDDKLQDYRDQQETVPRREDAFYSGENNRLDSNDDNTDDLDHIEQRSSTERATKTVCLLFSFVMFGSSLAVALIVYFYLRNAEEAEFEKQFRSDADKIFQSMGESLGNTLSVMDNFVTMVVAQKDALNTTFPFVAVSNYALQAAKVKTLAKAINTGIVLLVQEEERADWESFAAANNQFVQEAWDLQEHDPSFQASRDVFPHVEDRLFSNFPVYAERPEGSGPYLVIWQTYPIIYEVNGAVYNYDIFSVPVRFGKQCRKVLRTTTRPPLTITILKFLAKRWLPLFDFKQPTISGFSNLVDPTVDLIESDEADRISVEYIQNFINPNENAAEPITILLYPIRNRSNQLLMANYHSRDDSTTTSDDEEEEVVGSFSLTIFWRDLLRNTLPPSSRGLLVVTQNTCGQTFTYEINGAETTYLANTDVHDTQYDGIGLTATLTSILGKTTSSSFFHRCTDFSLLDSTCPITIRISPSTKNEEQYRSNDPVVFAIGAGLIFFFAGGLFLLYDFLVDRRRTI